MLDPKLDNLFQKIIKATAQGPRRQEQILAILGDSEEIKEGIRTLLNRGFLGLTLDWKLMVKSKDHKTEPEPKNFRDWLRTYNPGDVHPGPLKEAFEAGQRYENERSQPQDPRYIVRAQAKPGQALKNEDFEILVQINGQTYDLTPNVLKLETSIETNCGGVIGPDDKPIKWDFSEAYDPDDE